MHDIAVCGHNVEWHEMLDAQQKQKHEVACQQWVAGGGKFVPLHVLV